MVWGKSEGWRWHECQNAIIKTVCCEIQNLSRPAGIYNVVAIIEAELHEIGDILRVW